MYNICMYACSRICMWVYVPVCICIYLYIDEMWVCVCVCVRMCMYVSVSKYLLIICWGWRREFRRANRILYDIFLYGEVDESTKLRFTSHSNNLLMLFFARDGSVICNATSSLPFRAIVDSKTVTRITNNYSLLRWKRSGCWHVPGLQKPDPPTIPFGSFSKQRSPIVLLTDVYW